MANLFVVLVNVLLLCTSQNITADQVVSITVKPNQDVSASEFQKSFIDYSTQLSLLINSINGDNINIQPPKDIHLLCIKTDYNGMLIHATINLVYDISINAINLFNYIRDNSLTNINNIYINCISYASEVNYNCQIPNNAIILTKSTSLPITTNTYHTSLISNIGNINLAKGECLHYTNDNWIYYLKWSFSQFWYIYLIFGAIFFMIGAISFALIQIIWQCFNDRLIIKENLSFDKYKNNDNKVYGQIKLEQSDSNIINNNNNNPQISKFVQLKYNNNNDNNNEVVIINMDDDNNDNHIHVPVHSHSNHSNTNSNRNSQSKSKSKSKTVPMIKSNSYSYISSNTRNSKSKSTKSRSKSIAKKQKHSKSKPKSNSKNKNKIKIIHHSLRKISKEPKIKVDNIGICFFVCFFI